MSKRSKTLTPSDVVKLESAGEAELARRGLEGMLKNGKTLLLKYLAPGTCEHTDGDVRCDRYATKSAARQVWYSKATVQNFVDAMCDEHAPGEPDNSKAELIRWIEGLL